MGKRLGYAFLLAVLLVAALPQVCLACSCRLLPPVEAIAQADVIFRGRPIGSATQTTRWYDLEGSLREVGLLNLRFEVGTVWKGPIIPQLSIAQGLINDPLNAPNVHTYSSCNVRFSPGAEYIVFGVWQSGPRDGTLMLMAFNCSGTRLTQYAEDYLQKLGPGVAPKTVPPSTARGAVLGAYEIGSPAQVRGRSTVLSSSVDRPAKVFAALDSRPGDIVIDHEGHLFILGSRDNASSRSRVLKLSRDGEVTSIWLGNAQGGQNDAFMLVQSLAIDRQGALYLSSIVGVRKLMVSGRIDDTWGLQPSNNRVDIGLLAFDSQNRLYLYNPEHGLRRFADDGRLLGSWPESTWSVLNGTLIADIAIDQQGNVYLVERISLTGSDGDRVRKFSPEGVELATWGQRGEGPGEFKDPYSIAIDPWGNIYVADYGNDRVQQLSPSGEFIAAWGGFGTAPGQFRSPGSLAIDQRGNVYVADSGNFRIQRIPAAAR